MSLLSQGKQKIINKQYLHKCSEVILWDASVCIRLMFIITQKYKKLSTPSRQSQLPKSSDMVASLTCFRTTSSKILAMSLHPLRATSITLSR